MHHAKRRWPWLALGATLLVAAELRWGVALLAWVAPVPLLRYLRLTTGWRARLGFAGALVGAWVLATFKIITAPVPPMMAVFFGTAIAVFQLAAYLGTSALRRRLGDAWGAVAFPALMLIAEWVQHRFTPLSSWGATAYTQLDDLPLLQLASVTGIGGVGVLVHGVAAAAERLLGARLDRTTPPARAGLAVWLGAVLAAHLFGAIRLSATTPGTTKVATIGTDATFNGSATPSPEERARTLDQLFATTSRAADAGAKLAVWTEAAALVLPEEEGALVARLREAALRGQLDIVAAYVVLRSEEPLVFENKYQWARLDGAVDHAYLKHRPVPGEPAIAGQGPLRAVETDFGRAGGAICFDYDFPSLAAEHGALDLDVVALPSSDWRGIDPIHTEMAAIRAIEQGFSVVRSTRLGLSAAIDPLGRMRARQSSFEASDRLLVADIPSHGRPTLYRRLGDVLVYAAIAVVALLLVRAARARVPAAPRPGAKIVAL